ncbi:hypothetical protein I3760_02G006200 [Carya illinoinensis]|nr:hypothetical protein I3760_02G006200 [Carya illinoinensis]
MTTAHKYYAFFVFFLFLNSIFIATEARPFNVMETRSAVDHGGCGGFFDGLSLGAIKQSSPSPGDGHKFTQQQILGGIKQSGPSPGDGNKFTQQHTLGGIKQSGRALEMDTSLHNNIPLEESSSLAEPWRWTQVYTTTNSWWNQGLWPKSWRRKQVYTTTNFWWNQELWPKPPWPGSQLC